MILWPPMIAIPRTLGMTAYLTALVHHAIECGCDPLNRAAMANGLNTATHFGWRGSSIAHPPAAGADVTPVADLRALPIGGGDADGAGLGARGGLALVDCPHMTGRPCRRLSEHGADCGR